MSSSKPKPKPSPKPKKPEKGNEPVQPREKLERVSYIKKRK